MRLSNLTPSGVVCQSTNMGFFYSAPKNGPRKVWLNILQRNARTIGFSSDAKQLGMCFHSGFGVKLACAVLNWTNAYL